MRKTASDRRHHSRHAQSLTVSLHAPAQGLLDCKSMIVNLSLGGLCIETTAKISPESSFFFELKLPDGTSVAGMAQSSWERKSLSGSLFRYGAWILFMDPASERTLGQFLSTLPASEPLRLSA